MRKFSARTLVGCCLVTAAIVAPMGAFANSSTVQAIFGKINLNFTGKTSSHNTLYYNNTTYIPLKDIGSLLGGSIAYDANTNTATYTAKGATPATPTTSAAKPVAATSQWVAGKYEVTTAKKTEGECTYLTIANVKSSTFDFSLKTSNNIKVLDGTAHISGGTAICNVNSIYKLTFTLSGSEITVKESKSMNFANGSASYKPSTASAKPATPTTTPAATPISNPLGETVVGGWKNGNYASGSSKSAFVLRTTNFNGSSFNYTIASASNTSVPVSTGVAVVSGGTATSTTGSTHIITFKMYKDNVVTASVGRGTLFGGQTVTFYTE